MATVHLKEIIKSKLDELKMNPSELERKAGLAPSSIRKILLDESQNPTMKTLIAIAKVFRCSVDELVGNKIIRNRDVSAPLSGELLWDSRLMASIMNATCEYIGHNNIVIKFDQVIDFVIQTYSYCMVKKNGEFDSSFHEWYIQQKLT